MWSLVCNYSFDVVMFKRDVGTPHFSCTCKCLLCLYAADTTTCRDLLVFFFCLELRNKYYFDDHMYSITVFPVTLVMFSKFKSHTVTDERQKPLFEYDKSFLMFCSETVTCEVSIKF